MSIRLSPLRSKGWNRLGLLAAAAMIPLTAMEHALGYFAEGLKGLQQAAEYLVAGMMIALLFGFTAGWIAQGFAVRVKDEDDERESSRPASTAPARPPAQHR